MRRNERFALAERNEYGVTKNPSTRWKWARRIVLCLILGAIVNVAVAWGCAGWLTDTSQVHLHYFPGFVPPIATTPDASEVRYRYEELGFDLTDFWSWESTGGDGGRFYNIEAGWPWRSVGATAGGVKKLRPNSSYAFAEGGILLSSKYSIGSTRVLPFRPLWPGFLLNTLLYAAVLPTVSYGVLLGVKAMRSAIRTTHGLCPKCKYDLTGLTNGPTCPECGTTSPPSGRGEGEGSSIS